MLHVRASDALWRRCSVCRGVQRVTRTRSSRRTAATFDHQSLIFIHLGRLLAVTSNYPPADGKENRERGEKRWREKRMRARALLVERTGESEWSDDRLAAKKKPQGDVTWHFTYEYKWIYCPRKQRQYSSSSRRQATGWSMFHFHVMKNYSTSNNYLFFVIYYRKILILFIWPGNLFFN